MKFIQTINTIIFSVCLAFSLQATPVFEDGFESGLSQWEGKLGGAHNGITVADPLSSGHGQVLGFSAPKSGGDLFSIASFGPGEYTLSFDYLGVPATSGGFAGGYIGIRHWGDRWLAGSPAGGSLLSLVDDGAWHSYSVQFTSLTSFKLMLEDFKTPGGNALFDNVRLSTPEAGTTLALFGLSFAALAGVRRWTSRNLR